MPRLAQSASPVAVRTGCAGPSLAQSTALPPQSTALPPSGRALPVLLPVPLYTAAERARRDATVWTLVQGILAPVQFCIFAVSVFLVLRYLTTGEGHAAAAVSVVVKTLALYTIMVTGCIWEKVVFGRYLFAPMFFWEDVFSMLVLALHTTYLVALTFGLLDDRSLMWLALAAYATYAINAAQFIVKLRAARRGGVRPAPQDEATEWAEWAV